MKTNNIAIDYITSITVENLRKTLDNVEYILQEIGTENLTPEIKEKIKAVAQYAKPEEERRFKNGCACTRAW